mgnify:CR=1 FL=1|jgi:methyltransferase, FkbM family
MHKWLLSIKEFGIYNGLKIIVYKFMQKMLNIQNEHLLKIKRKNLPEFFIRPFTTDINVLYQIFLEKEHKLDIQIQPKLIIDAGANIGLSTIYFAEKYPSSKIIAIEPEDSNYAMLELNTKDYSNIEIKKAAVWNINDVQLAINDRGEGKWGFTVEHMSENHHSSVMTVTVDALLKHSEFEEIDILKLDVEGAEKEIFSKHYETWLNKVNIIIIELHDRIKNGCTEVFFAAIENYDFEILKKGEKFILVNKKLRNTA